MVRWCYVLVGSFLFLAPFAATGAEVRGRIAQFDAEKNALRLPGIRADRGRGIWLPLAADVSITWASQPAQKDDLTRGRRVALTYDEGEGRKVVTRIEILGPRPSRGVAREAGELVRGVLLRAACTQRDVVVQVTDSEGKSSETMCWADEDVRVLRDGQPITYEELKEGETVVVRFEMRNGRRVAVAIQVGKVPESSGPAPWVARLRLVLRLVDWVLGQVERE